MRCPKCDTEFSTPYAREVLRNGGYLYCPRGCKLEIRVDSAEHLDKAGQIAELEYLHSLEVA